VPLLKQDPFQTHHPEQSLPLLAGRAFPGNIRELRNIIERLAILSDGDVIDEAFVSSSLGAKKSENNYLFVNPRPLADAKNDLEKVYVKTQLELNGWDIPKTADILGLARTNLHRKIKQLGIER
jgi:two-component system nitrogen regulation response regulator NtrX